MFSLTNYLRGAGPIDSRFDPDSELNNVRRQMTQSMTNIEVHSQPKADGFICGRSHWKKSTRRCPRYAAVST